MALFWRVKDFRRINKPWGNFRVLVDKIDIANGDAFIGLFRENDDGRYSICVHQSNKKMITSLGFYWVDNTPASKQEALDRIFEELMRV